MKAVKQIRKAALAAGLAFGLVSAPAHAGIPVIDGANLAQSIQQVISWMQQASDMATQISQYAQQINQFKEQIENMEQNLDMISGVRGLGNIANNPMLKGSVPAGTADLFSSVAQAGEGLTSDAQTIRNANKVYDCADREGAALNDCKALLNFGSQVIANQRNALETVTERVNQIQQLQDQINTTTDPKEIAELQARISAEQAQVQNDANRIQLMNALAEAEKDAILQRKREREMAMFAIEDEVGDDIEFDL